MKHAYLIIAHGEFELLQKLVSSIDDIRNDIYIHFDLKIDRLPALNTKFSKLTVIQKRVKVYWGDYSIVKAEFELLKSALLGGKYEYFHIISGVDLPIKSQNYIHSFFSKNFGKEFIGIYNVEMHDELERRYQKYHLFTKYFSKYRSQYPIQRGLRALFLRLQYLVGFKSNKGIVFKKGSQWVSITERMAKYIVSREEYVESVFKHTFCPDESFIQTLCWNSEFVDSVHNINNEGLGNLRAVKWVDHILVDWEFEEIDGLLNGEYIFARKFSSSQYSSVDKIIKCISQS